MDPNKSPSAPPQEWNEEKTPMVEKPLPPPYEVQQGAPQPGYGYPTQPQGYGYPGPTPYPGPGYAQHPNPANQPYPGQPGMVTVQPAVFVAQGPLENPVKDYLCYSIFTMICCCLPLGIAALIHSISAREANLSGNQMMAERSSRTARTLNHVALGLGIGGFLLLVIYFVVIISIASF